MSWILTKKAFISLRELLHAVILAENRAFGLKDRPLWIGTDGEAVSTASATA
jgi:hypothetical protein